MTKGRTMKLSTVLATGAASLLLAACASSPTPPPAPTPTPTLSVQEREANWVECVKRSNYSDSQLETCDTTWGSSFDLRVIEARDS
jgi:hypothetical protein